MFFLFCVSYGNRFIKIFKQHSEITRFMFEIALFLFFSIPFSGERLGFGLMFLIHNLAILAWLFYVSYHLQFIQF